MMPSTGKYFGEARIFTAAEIVAGELAPVSWIGRDRRTSRRGMRRISGRQTRTQIPP
jgi:hypothetical protein